jgi:hypothetical protein
MLRPSKIYNLRRLNVITYSRNPKNHKNSCTTSEKTLRNSRISSMYSIKVSIKLKLIWMDIKNKPSNFKPNSKEQRN